MNATYKEEWTYRGRKCEIHWNDQHYGGHWTGYVKTDPANPEIPSDPQEIPVDVHGGITWGPDNDGWIGFDCAHAGDYNQSPDGEIVGLSTYRGRRRLWTRSKVREETERLADQLNNV